MRVGITERGDPSLDFSWVSKLLPANIIITKNLNDELIKHLIDNNNKERIILHLTCTGFGGSIVEPKVPPKEYSLIQFEKLLSGGFPVRQTVLRVDPIVPTPKGAGFQREGCLCIAGKTELLSSKRRCLHGCLYCYWKD